MPCRGADGAALVSEGEWVCAVFGGLSHHLKPCGALETAMPRYYVDAYPQSNGDHEVHKYGCDWLSMALQAQDLGEHDDCTTALAAARHWHAAVNGCEFCVPECHLG